MLWVALRPTGVEPPYEIFAVTADPAEGEAWTQSGSDLVDVVPMPEAVRAAIDAFVAEHHVERPFFKRKRDRADPEALARRGAEAERARMSDPDNFIARWSRRKRAAARSATRRRRRRRQTCRRESAQQATASAPATSAVAPSASEPPELPFDLANLPPLEFDHRRERHPRLPRTRASRPN